MVQLAHVFNARIVDVAPESLVLEMSGSEAKIDSLLEVLQPYGVLEMARAGRIAMERRASADGAVAREAEAQPLETGISYSV
jgi:acetolactate synthase-1/3 small subunit